MTLILLLLVILEFINIKVNIELLYKPLCLFVDIFYNDYFSLIKLMIGEML